MSLAQGNNTPTRPRIEPGSRDPESDALTTRPVRPLLGPVCLPSSRCGYLIYIYVLPVALIIVSLMTGMHVLAWAVYDLCVCLLHPHSSVMFVY